MKPKAKKFSECIYICLTVEKREKVKPIITQEKSIQKDNRIESWPLPHTHTEEYKSKAFSFFTNLKS